MKCFNCNSDVADGNSFCPQCGTVLKPQQNNIESSNSLNQVESFSTNIVNNVQADVNVESVVQNNVQNEQSNVINPPVEQANNEQINYNVVQTPIMDLTNQMVNNVNLEQPSVIESTPVVNNTNYVESMNIVNDYNTGLNEIKNVEVKGKSKTPFVIASILIIIVLAIVGVCGYLFMNSPKKEFVTLINKSTDFLMGAVDSKMYTSDTVSVDFDLKTTNKIVDEDMGPIFNIIKNISLNGKTQIDYKNKTLLMDLNSNYNNNELVKLSGYITNEKIYVDLYDLYDKKISTDLEGINEFFKLNEYSKDILSVVDEVKNVVNNSLKDEYFVNETVKMNVNGLESSVNKTILLLNYNNLKSLLNDVLASLKSNEKFLSSYVNIMKLEDDEITKQDIIDELDDMLEEINDEVENTEGDIKVILYTKGFNKEFVGFAIEDNTSEYGADFSIINDKENIYTIKYFDGYEESEAIIKVNGDVYTLELEESDTKIEFGLNIKTYDIDYKLINGETTVTGSLKTDKDGKKNLNILCKIEGNEIGIDVNYITKYNESVSIPGITSSVDIDSISDEDGMTILNKLQEKQGVKDLMKEIESLTTNMLPSEPTYDYDNNYNGYNEYEF